MDQSLLLALLFLMGLGLVQVYSSSYIFAIERFGDGLFFIRKQLLHFLLGLLVLLGVGSAPAEKIRKYGWLLWLLAVVGVGLTLLPQLGIKSGGATRWLKLPFSLRFEPGELLKYSLPFMAAYFLCSFKSFSSKWWYLFWGFLLLAPLLLLLKQPDFGTFTICLVVLGGMFFVYGLRWRYIFLGLLGSLASFIILIWNVPYRRARWEGFLDPWADPAAKGFQVIQSLLGFQSGGLWGTGLGEGQSKLFFLPEAHTDFIFSVFAEEAGLIRVLFVILIYAFVIFKGFQIVVRTRDMFFQAVALGVTMALGLSVFINLGVVMGLLPTKGLTLPFMSYGGSSLLSSCLACGILLSIHRAQAAGKKSGARKQFHGLSINK